MFIFLKSTAQEKLLISIRKSAYSWLILCESYDTHRLHYTNSQVHNTILIRANLISHMGTVDNEQQYWNLIQNLAYYNICYHIINILQFPL